MDSVAEFYSFPFLRDEVFLKLLRAVNVTKGGFRDAVFKAQLAYYQQYINPTFNSALLLAPRTDIPPQCPFSRKRKVGTELSALDENLLKPGLAFYAEGRVSMSSRIRQLEFVKQVRPCYGTLSSMACLGKVSLN